MSSFLLLAVCLLAYSNGANDNFKSVASLFGSRTTNYKTAIGWATITTLAGSLCSLFLAQALLEKFSGKGLVPDQLAGSEPFLLAIALGAGLTVILATFAGFPVSTTHGLTGAMVGAGLVAAGAEVRLGALGSQILLPLLLSPVLAVVLGAGLYLSLRWVRLRLGITKEHCICLGQEQQLGALTQPSSALVLQDTPAMLVALDREAICTERYTGGFLGVKCQQAIDAAHFLSAGAVGFARGLNDTPKMAALLLLIKAPGIHGSLALVSVAVAVGGLLSARRVAETMSHKITKINHGQGFSANLATALLVIFASRLGLPVSTTHVSVGSLLGIGVTTRQANYRVVSGILLSWLLTLPCAAFMAALAYWLLSR